MEYTGCGLTEIMEIYSRRFKEIEKYNLYVSF